MMPRRITELEQEYNRIFPGNPAPWFYPKGDAEEPFRRQMRQAIDIHTPLGESDIIDVIGEEGYRRYKAYLEEWYEMTITWSEDTHADPH